MVRCCFQNKVKGTKQKAEQISQFHPLIRFISDDLTRRGESSFRVIAVYLEASQLIKAVPTGDYGFVVSRWTFKGLSQEEQLQARIVPMNSDHEMFSMAESMDLINTARIKGSDWLAASNELDLGLLSSRVQECEDILFDDFQETSNEKRNENIDKVNFQRESLKINRERELSIRQGILQTHERNNRLSLAAAIRGQIKKLETRVQVQIESLNKGAEFKPFQETVCYGVLRVST